MRGLYRETGTERVYFVSGISKRWIVTPEDLTAEFGADAWSLVEEVPPGTIDAMVARGRLILVAIIAAIAFIIWRRRS